jgi:hypothetical protein
MNTSKNLELWSKKLYEVGVDTTSLVEEYGSDIETATFSNLSTNGLAYEGSLLQTLLYKLTPYALKLNDMFPESIRVDRDKIIKVCLLQHIAKSVRLIKNENDWEVKNRGMVYKYNPSNPSIRNGLHSLQMCYEHGIMFSVDEVEAMTINDRDLTDDQARWHSSLFASIIRQANEMVYLESINALNKQS